MNEIKITIDGKTYSTAEGRTILEVATEKGIEIPTLCHNREVSKSTSCFVCIVKNLKTGRFLPSCSAMAESGMEIASDSEEVNEMRRTALNLLLSEHRGDCEAPCTIACPAHAQVEEYVREIKKGNYEEGLKLIKERIPLPISVGRVCPRFCEKDCRRNVVGEGVAINDFKRLAADRCYDTYMEEMKELGNKKVAVIGAGPAGLAAAYYLRIEGIGSDIFDMMPEAGGMLRYGIPEYRLPKTLLDKEIDHFRKMGGIEIHTSKKLGEDISLDELKKKYDAVLIAVGSWKSSSMRAEGEEHAVGGIDFLQKIALNGWNGENPGKTIVIGGGNTAMDCLRTSVRLGSGKVICLYRRTEAEMPAEKIEIEEAKEEGVEFHFLAAPLSLRVEDEKKILTCIEMKLGEPDASGRRRPVTIEGSEFEIEADTVIAAIGQKTAAPEGLKLNRWGDVDVDEKNCSMEGAVFSAGDCVSGPATVVEALAGGRRAALGIAAYLENDCYEEDYRINVSRGHWNSLRPDELVFLKEPVERDRVPQRLIPMEERLSTFKEVSHTYSEDEIALEGERCYECSCTSKKECTLKKHSETYLAKPDEFTGEKLLHAYDTRHPSIIMDPNKCIKCGTCVKICKDIMDRSIFGFKNRGYSTVIGTAFGVEIPGSCSDCGKCIESCPVGALDWKNK